MNFYSKSKKMQQLVGFTIEMYCDARSYERQTSMNITKLYLQPFIRAWAG
jgi:hypothetical protein